MRLGPFRLDRPLGRGGMGQVWMGTHANQSVPVAIKVIADELAATERFKLAFADEVRAVARLDHQSIVTVFDHGRIPAEVARGSRGQLVEGTPYFVMEYCNGGSLRGVTHVDGYAELRNTLLQLLDALAHAHARGVIHRDIKPGNVMLTLSEDGDEQLKLTDFGIARAVDNESADVAAGSSGTGTPGYMAPEQIVGDVMAQGPWTDLYAVGCLAYRLATGHVPFALAGDDKAVLAAHLRDPVPPLEAHFAVPDGLEGWIARLLHKNPCRRFRFAADAIWALLSLGDPDSDSIPSRDTLTEIGEVLSEDTALDAPTITTLALFEEETYAGDDGVGDLERIADAPPVPVSFRRSARSERPPALVGAGLGLFGMRPLPIVGRDEERKLLWRMLREVASSTRPRLVFLRGPSGCGKSRLAEWISERAHELGSATVMRASHAAVPGPSHGLGAMLAAYFGCSGAPRDGVISLLRATLDEGPAFDHLALALTEIIAPLEGPPQTSVPPPSGGATSRRVRFADMHEQHAVIAQLFRWLSMSRPVLMWLDDVQWSASALALSEYLLDQEGIRLFIIATEQTEVTTKRPVERARIERLIARGADTLPLEPLTIDEHRELVRHLLGLEGKLASRVEKLTLDSPLFAVQLVGDWVQRGVLLSSDQGFRLREGERAELPDSLHALWERRVAQLAEGHDREAFLEALEIAALLGDRVDRREWQDVCERRGVRLPRDIEGSLVESGLARVIPMGFGFCHALLRESLERSAERNQRAVAHHRACAAMLEERFADLAATAERLAHHLYVAGAPEAAIHHLDRAIAFRFDRGDFDRVDHLLEQREAALAEALGTTSTGNDPRHVTGELWRIRVLLARDEFESAARVLRRTEGVAHVHRDIASLCQLHAELRWARGQMVEAADLARGAQKQFEALDDPVAAADCRRIVVKCNLESRGDFREALSEARLAREVYVEAHDLDRIAECDYLEAKILTELLDFDGAKHACAAARSHHDGQGHRLGVARCENQWGEIARLQGELETAEQSYLRAAALLEAMGSEAAAGVRLNLAIVLVARGRYRRAEGELVELREQMTKRGHERALGFIDYALLPCLASEGKWSELDALLGHAARRVPAEGRVDKDFAALAEKAADLAMGAGQAERADQLRALASEHYRALGLSGEVERVEAERASTRPPPSG